MNRLTTYITTAVHCAAATVTAFALAMLGAWLIMSFIEWQPAHFDWAGFRKFTLIFALLGFAFGLVVEYLMGERP